MYNNYLPDFEADISRLALFGQQIGGGGLPPPRPSPGTPMNVAAYNYSRNTHQHDLRHNQYKEGQTESSGLQHDSDLLTKPVRDEVRRQQDL